MKFERESWRKLYIVESAEHRLLPMFTRGMRDYLLRLASDDGTILRNSKNPKGDFQRLLNARPAERKLIDRGYDDLVGIAYLTVEEDGRVWITKFQEAQESRSPEARRQAVWRETHGKPPRDTSKTDFGSIRRLRQLDGGLCSYCRVELDFRLGRSPQKATLDHVVPRSKGGSDGEDNLVLACSTCNSKKSYRTPTAAGMPLLCSRVLALRPDFGNDVSDDVTNNVREENETRRDEKDPPTPLSELTPVPANGRRKTDQFMRSFTKPSRERADVLALFDEWKALFGFPEAKLCVGIWNADADTLASAIDAHGFDLCRLVLRHAPDDGMVSGRDDERRAAHPTIAYIFENQNTFLRISKAARQATATSSPGSASEMIRRAKERRA